MAKVTFSTDIQSISGKLCSKEGVIYSVNQQTGKTYRSDRHGYSMISLSSPTPRTFHR